MIFSTAALFSSAVIAAPLPENDDVHAMKRNVEDLRSNLNVFDCLPYEEKLFDCVKNVPIIEYSSLGHAVGKCKQKLGNRAARTADRGASKRRGITEEDVSNAMRDLKCERTRLTRAKSATNLKDWSNAMRDLKCEHEFLKVYVPMMEKIFDCVKYIRADDYKNLSSAKSKCAKQHGYDPKKVDQKYQGCPAKNPKQQSPSQKRN